MRSGWILAHLPFVALLALLIPAIWPQDGVGDTFRFWFAGHIVATGGSPYDQSAWASTGDTYGIFAREMAIACAPGPNAPVCLWPYPPTTALLFAPFGMLAVREGMNALAAFFVALAATSVVVVGQWMRARSLATRALAMCACVVSHPFVFDVHAGHFEGLGVIGIVLVAIGLTGRHVAPVVAGALLLAVKPHLYAGLAVIVLVVLLARRDWRTLGWTGGIVAAVNGLAFVLYPEALAAMLGRAGQVVGLGWATTWAFASTILPAAVGIPVVYAIAAVAFAAAVRFAPTDRRIDVLVTGGAAAALVVSPYVQPYDFLVLFPAFATAMALHGRLMLPARGVLLTTTAGTLALGTWIAIFGTRVPLLPGALPVVVLVLLAIAAWTAHARGAADGLRGTAT